MCVGERAVGEGGLASTLPFQQGTCLSPDPSHPEDIPLPPLVSLIFHCSCSESKIVACFSNHSSSFWIFQENLTPWDREVPAQGFVRPCELSGVQSSH